MKTDSRQPALTSKSFYDFIKLSKTRQTSLLKEKGILLDFDNENNIVTRLYFLNGFFVEEIMNQQSSLSEIIPYKQGYRIESYQKN
jgi:hypothetical protein